MTYLLYNLLTVSIASFLFPFLLIYLFRTGKLPYFLQYFGYFGRKRKETHHLFHAVSVGETKSIINVARRLTGKSVITTTCVPVVEYVRKNAPNIECVFYPLDTKFTVRLLLDTFRVRGVFISEVDYWPCLLKESRDRLLPVCILNARLSKETYRFMTMFRTFWIELFKGVDMIFLQSPQMKESFSCFIEDRKMIFLGNLKFEDNTEKEENKKELFIAGSTHWPEERYILEAATKIDLKTVIAPRNMDKLNQIISHAKEKDIDVSLYSKTGLEGNIIILDCFGVLSSLYKRAVFSYVGGGFTCTGVHSFLEPASYGCPFFTGPNVKNFKVEEKIFEDAFIKIDSLEEINTKILELADDREKIQAKRNRIKEIVKENSGADEKIAKLIMVNMYG